VDKLFSHCKYALILRFIIRYIYFSIIFILSIFNNGSNAYFNLIIKLHQAFCILIMVLCLEAIDVVEIV